ncbi:SGNH/GDSL hydrolase family protein [Cohnella suwonensis]|uniref:SGNH/GDSL hydrolase family protein n=1 Tax=Cohnella suwonensis TaxID=696072 RepID=A0ABW0M0F7_9BACL
MIEPIVSREQVRYTGRFDFSQPEGPQFAWSGSSIAISFKGTEVRALLKPVQSGMADNWVNIVIDDQEPVPVKIDKENSYLLALNLANEVHTVEIFKRTEPMVGELQFMGFELPEGAELLEPPSRHEHKIEIIGDSITAGYGNEAASIEDGFQASQENHYLAYGPIAARSLNAELIALAWSGKGMYQNYGGVRDIQMPELYRRTLPSRSESSWDFHSRVPDVVVINLGTNDFSVDTIDPSQYVAEYKRFVEFIRTNYPDAHLFCTIGPMNRKPAEFIEGIVSELNRAGDERIYFYEFPPQNVEKNGVGGDWHPSLKTHAIMAELLAAEIKNKLGW